jgi:hypothetical protein
MYIHVDRSQTAQWRRLLSLRSDEVKGKLPDSVRRTSATGAEAGPMPA